MVMVVVRPLALEAVVPATYAFSTWERTAVEMR